MLNGKFPDSRCAPAFAARWPHVEPVTHRVPVPLPVIEALISLAWQLSWKRWAAVSAICFFGIAGAGEVLRCRRKDLLLPSDLLQDASGAAYVVLWQSKTSQRQAASVQHLKITESRAVSLFGICLSRCFCR